MTSHGMDIIDTAQQAKASGEQSRASLDKFLSKDKDEQYEATKVLDNADVLRRWLLIEQGWSHHHELLITVHPTKANAWIVTVVPKMRRV